jgi:hypothetical protein
MEGDKIRTGCDAHFITSLYVVERQTFYVCIGLHLTNILLAASEICLLLKMWLGAWCNHT